MRKIALLLTLIMVFTVTLPALAANPFTDVPLGHWAYDAIAKVAELGIMEGTPQGDFNGQAPMTRYQMAKTTAAIVDLLEEKNAQLKAEQKKEVQQIVDALKAEFNEELKLVKADVNQNKEDIKDLKGKVDFNKKLSIVAIVLSLVAVASN
ncbi:MULTISPECIES: S-layer homology domain-containing protein [unclassified Candidatus Frackibacter]|jgi:hypothetical protein|uniref:S-layer homology domain-containing protein n=1 Tax=unclassified Candidatus Frackibacter TaxID=2648818 RepID=UPI000885BDA5|nr:MULTISPECIES: S-layer homology domain-containing protein [unclassified Candidatus Frackibacter]SDC09000.1 S-layer homology domain-containing protein [Candidatus Frackibacter sp. WG11]SEM38017.1 S-layer homology domain-containing protein [Candidatus Frackibacter sp. WG12]SFL43509.1 S-layer homology domain-containing protein [Candidatus Frackibacter sp. WG13]